MITPDQIRSAGTLFTGGSQPRLVPAEFLANVADEVEWRERESFRRDVLRGEIAQERDRLHSANQAMLKRVSALEAERNVARAEARYYLQRLQEIQDVTIKAISTN